MADFEFSQQFLGKLDREDLVVMQGADPDYPGKRYVAVCNSDEEPLAVLWQIDQFASVFDVEDELRLQLEGVLEG